MSHNIRCEMAMSPPEKCQCKCGGKFHGIHAQDLAPGARFMNKAAGGELGRIIQSLNRKQLTMKCGIQTKALFIGLSDPNGIPDRTGKKWAVYTKCRHFVDGKCTRLNVTPDNTAKCSPSCVIVPTSSGVAEINYLSLVETKNRLLSVNQEGVGVRKPR